MCARSNEVEATASESAQTMVHYENLVSLLETLRDMDYKHREQLSWDRLQTVTLVRLGRPRGVGFEE